MPILLSKLLPEYFLNYLTTLSNIKIHDGDIPLIELVDSPEACSAFLNFININDDDNTNMLVLPTFGHPLKPYITPLEQVEVFNLLATYTLQENPKTFTPAQFPVHGGFQYYKTNLVKTVIEQIQSPILFMDKCIGLCTISDGNIICDLTITYANTIIVIRILRVK
jgi:hypothetical protein